MRYWYINMRKKEYDENLIIKISNESLTANEAAKFLNIPFTSFKRIAKKLGCYKTNQRRIGKKTENFNKKYLEKFEKTLKGLRPEQRSTSIRNLLIKYKFKIHQCECCKLTEWMNKKIPLELHHVDGNNRNHKLENLQLLCPNCHTITDGYSGRKKY